MSTRSVPLFPLSKQFRERELVGGRYRLVRQIGAGAMGTVWVAHNELLDIDVAIKVLRVDNQKADPTRLYKRLLREARAAARLGHPGIVRVFDFGQTEDKSPYIVMELLEGESLAELMVKKPRMETVEAVQFILPIVDALAMAHGRGIIHRDVKPENIFLSRDEYGRLQPKIVDFGVARFAEAGRSLTRSGALLGTPDYMAPEQARGEPDIDHRVDIWALCIVLYELVTGRRPFARDATNYLAVLRAIVHEPAPSILTYGVGNAALWLIVERGLKKRAKDRWETMRVLGEALALWLYERGIREDALGASLKTTWLQSGIDGIKIETPSMMPPRPAPSQKVVDEKPEAEIPRAEALSSFDVLVESEPPRPVPVETVKPQVPASDLRRPVPITQLPTEVRERPARFPWSGFLMVFVALVGGLGGFLYFETNGHPVHALAGYLRRELTLTVRAELERNFSDAQSVERRAVPTPRETSIPVDEAPPVVTAGIALAAPAPSAGTSLAEAAPVPISESAPISKSTSGTPLNASAAAAGTSPRSLPRVQRRRSRNNGLPSAKTYDLGF